MDKYDGGSTLIVFGIVLMAVYLLIPRSLRKNWFIDSGVEGRRRSRILGLALILLGILVIIFG